MKYQKLRLCTHDRRGLFTRNGCVVFIPFKFEIIGTRRKVDYLEGDVTWCWHCMRRWTKFTFFAPPILLRLAICVWFDVWYRHCTTFVVNFRGCAELICIPPCQRLVRPLAWSMSEVKKCAGKGFMKSRTVDDDGKSGQVERKKWKV